MITKDYTTLERIHRAAFEEFLEKGFKSASLRNIVKKVNMTTGAFYGYYNSKEELFEALVDEHYQYLINCFKKAQRDFAGIPYELSRIISERSPDSACLICSIMPMSILMAANCFYAVLREQSTPVSSMRW